MAPNKRCVDDWLDDRESNVSGSRRPSSIPPINVPSAVAGTSSSSRPAPTAGGFVKSVEALSASVMG